MYGSRYHDSQESHYSPIRAKSTESVLTSLFVDVVDCAVIRVDWYVDGAIVARAHDDTDSVRLPRESLTQTVRWQVTLGAVGG